MRARPSRGIASSILAATMLLACQRYTAEKSEGEARAETSKAQVPAEKSEGEVRAAPARDALVGQRAPDVVLEVLDGQRVALAQLVGEKPVYLKFWATWCRPCVKQMPHLEAAHRKYRDRIAVYAVDLGLNDPIEAVRAFRAEKKLTVPIAIDRDGGLAERFHVTVTPQHVLIDRSGVVRYVGYEANDDLDAALETLLGNSTSPDRPRDLPAAEALSLNLLGGSTFELAEQAGTQVALTFVSTSFDRYLAETHPAISEACIAHARQVESLRRSHDRVVWVTIAHPVWSTTAKLDDYRKRLGHGSPIGLDEQGRWFHRFKVRDVPTTILLDERGAEVARVSGRGDDLPAALSRLRQAPRSRRDGSAPPR
jgi:peroxiredoxin